MYYAILNNKSKDVCKFLNLVIEVSIDDVAVKGLLYNCHTGQFLFASHTYSTPHGSQVEGGPCELVWVKPASTYQRLGALTPQRPRCGLVDLRPHCDTYP